MRSRTWFNTFATALLLGQSAFAQEPLHLSLEQAMEIALERNLGLRSTRLGVQIQEQGVAVEAARFGRAFGMNFSQQRRLEKQRSEVDLEHLRQQLEQQARERFRQVGINRRRTEVALLAEHLATQNVSEEEERLKLGLSTVRQVLDVQDDLAQVRASRLRAAVDYNQALIEWERLTGE